MRARLVISLLLLLLGESQSRIDVCPFTARCGLWGRQIHWMATGRSLSTRHDVLGGEDVLVACSIALGGRCGGRGWRRHEGETARLAGRSVLILPAASTPVQTNAVVACLTALGAVGADGLLLAAFDLACFAGPTTRATSLLGFCACLFLRSRHRGYADGRYVRARWISSTCLGRRAFACGFA